MGNDPPSHSREEWAAIGRTYLRDAQAIVDCFSESELSAAEKEHCYKTLEEWPALCWSIVVGGFNLRSGKLWFIRTHALIYKLKNPNRQHGYRGRAEWPTRPTPTVAVVDDSQPSESDAHQPAAGDRDSECVGPQPVEGSHVDECAALLAKKDQ